MFTELSNGDTFYRGKGVRKKSPKYKKWYGWRKDHRNKRSKIWREKISQSMHNYYLKRHKQRIINHDI